MTIINKEKLKLFKESIQDWVANQNYKKKQTAVADPSASGNSISFIDTITQDADGKISPTKKTIPNSSSSSAGLMSKDDFTKLKNIASNANNYSLPKASSSTLGGIKVGDNLSITDDGKLSATDTTYENFTAATTDKDGTQGLVPAPAKATSSGAYLCSTGEWKVPPDTNTTYEDVAAATTDKDGTHGLVPAPKTTDSDKYLYSNGTWKALPDFTAATTDKDGTHGLVPAPAKATSNKAFLKSDGTWAIPPDTNTTYVDATTTKHGLMSTTDKTKLDGIESGANNYSLPKATSSTLGGIIVGDNLSISNDGKLSADDMTYSLPNASSTTLGGIKVGSNLSISNDGTLSATDTTYKDFEGATQTEGGTSGLVPGPSAGDQLTYLCGNGEWMEPDTVLSALSSNSVQNRAVRSNIIGVVCSSTSYVSIPGVGMEYAANIPLPYINVEVGTILRILFTTDFDTTYDSGVPYLYLRINGKTVGSQDYVCAYRGYQGKQPIQGSGVIIDAGTTLEVMYDGTNWVVMGNPIVKSLPNSSNGSYIKYANGLIIQWASLVANSAGELELPTSFTSKSSYSVISSLNGDNNSGTTQRDQFRPYSASTIYKNADMAASYIAIGW